jgi:uncharacterized protein YndB with AHSA1/START domain
MSKTSFTIERIFNSPVETVWQAITNKDQMKQWYFDLAAFEARPGFEFQFTGQGKDGVTEYLHLCKVVEAVPLQKLSYSWKYKDYEGDSLVTFELFEEGSGTRLKLTHAGLDTFPADKTDFDAANFAEGWTSIIGQSLDKFLTTIK